MINSLKNLLNQFPYFLNKNEGSNFVKSQMVTNEQFKNLSNDLHNVYRSFHLNKRCLIWKEQVEPYDYIIHFRANYPNLKSVKLYQNNVLFYSETFEQGDDVNNFEYDYNIREKRFFEYNSKQGEVIGSWYPNGCVGAVVDDGLQITATGSGYRRYEINDTVLQAPYSISFKFQKKNALTLHLVLIKENSAFYSNFVNLNNYDLNAGDYVVLVNTGENALLYVNNEFVDTIDIVTGDDYHTAGFALMIAGARLIFDDFVVSPYTDYYGSIPDNKFKMIIETFDEYVIEKGFPENDEKLGDIYDHDESLDEIGAFYNIPRKEYLLVQESKYHLTEPPFNNKLSEDDYHYMNRILGYIALIHTVPLSVAEVWKLYGILPEMINRQKYLLKVFDIFQKRSTDNSFYYDDSVDEQGNYTCFGDRLFVGDWEPRAWEHKDIFYDYSKEFGIYFFAHINSNTPSSGQPLKLTFKFLNNLNVDVGVDFLIDLELNGETIVSNFTGLEYPPQSAEENNSEEIINYPRIENLLDNLEDNFLKITAKTIDGEIIGVETIIIRVRGCGTADYYVKLDGDDDNDGNNESPFRSIEKALNSVHGNKNVVSIGSGEYDFSKQTLKDSCTLLGCPNDNEEVIINNDEDANFFIVPAGKELILKNIKLQHENTLVDIDSAVYTNNNYTLPLTVNMLSERDILFNPEFTSENLANVTSGGNGFSSSQSNGVWTFTNAWLSDGWSNEGYWECDFDLKCTGLRYIGFKILCLLDGTTILGGWENCIATNIGDATRDNNDCLGLLHENIYSNPDTPWVHIHIERTSPTRLSITKTNDTANNGTVNYTWEGLSNISAFTIGAGNNSGSNFGTNKVQIKNLIVKKI